MKAVSRELIDGLKESLRRIAPTATFDPEPAAPGEGGLSTGLAALDQILATGGLAAGKLTEIAGGPSSGKTALALTAIASITTKGAGLAAFIDGRDQLYPPAAAALGVDLERLLVVKPPASGIARAAEILVRSRGFELIVVDLPAQHRLARSVAHRLRTAAHQTRTALAVLCNRAGDVDAAHARLEVRAAGDLDAPATAVSVRKGSRTGELVSAVIDLYAFRSGARAGAPIAPVLERTPPGVDPISGGVP